MSESAKNRGRVWIEDLENEALENLVVSDALEKSGALIVKNTPDPVIASIGGEWAVLGLARSGYPAPESLYANYYANVLKEIRDKNGVLTTSKYTEYSRVILALTSIGKDVTDVGGYNLLTYLTKLENVRVQGINGPVWALFAFDSYNYDIPMLSGLGTQVTREILIRDILDRELSEGGWSLDGPNPDPDMTGMVIQSLAGLLRACRLLSL